MNCLKVNDIYDYIEGALSPEQKEMMEGHLGVCPKCRRAIEDREFIAEAASSLPPFAVPDDFTDRVMARIAPAKINSPAWLIILASTSSLLALAAMITIASGRSALEIVSGASHFLWEFIKSTAVFTAKAATLFSLAGKTAQPLLEAAYKSLSVLTSFIHPGVQALILVLAMGFVVSLFFRMRKKFSLGD